MQSYEMIRHEQDGAIATITLARPDRLNALNQRMADELIDAFDRTDADEDIRAVIVTGEGRAFCAGFDLDKADAFDVGCGPVGWEALPDDHPVRDLGGRLVLRIHDSLKPIIAAVNGPAVGIGATMLLPMDIRYASDTARIGFPFGRRGIVPDGASAWFLPRVVGVGAAMDWMLSGRLVPAEEAVRDGLVRAVFPAADLIGAAKARAAEIASEIAPVSASLLRQMLWHGLGQEHPMDMHRIDSRLIAERGAHADSREGVASFLERRAPDFPGRVPRDLPRTFPWAPAKRFS